MPWSRTSPMDQKIRFIADHQRGFFSFPELCARFGISRRTGYKWVEGFRTDRTVRSIRPRGRRRLPRGRLEVFDLKTSFSRCRRRSG
jgi:putative transposase